MSISYIVSGCHCMVVYPFNPNVIRDNIFNKTEFQYLFNPHHMI